MEKTKADLRSFFRIIFSAAVRIQCMDVAIIAVDPSTCCYREVHAHRA